MAKNEGLWIAGAIILAVFLLGKQGTGGPSTVTTNGDSNVDLCKLVSGQMSLTGQRMFLTGTPLTTEFARVISADKKQDVMVSMNSGTLGTTPKKVYNIYYGENSTTRYATKEAYTAPCQEATDAKVGELCTIDTSPTITETNEDGTLNPSGAQAVAISDSVQMELKVKVSADECYGNPQSTKDNAICFAYNSTVYEEVSASTGDLPESDPDSIASIKPAGFSVSCYKLPKLKDNGVAEMTVTITARNVEPGAGDDITYYLEDTDMDINADTLEEIWGFEDEDDNNLGDGINTGTLDIS